MKSPLSLAEWIQLLLIPVGTLVLTWLWRAIKQRRKVWAARDERSDAIAKAVTDLRIIADQQTKDITEIKYEVRTNGGKSLKDELVGLRNEMRISEASRRMVHGRATWEGKVEADGRVTPLHVSADWIRLTGMSREDTANGGWSRAIAREDYDRVCEEAEYAATHAAVLDVEYTVVNVHAPHARTVVRHFATPVFDLNQRLIGWVGEMIEQPPRERRGAPTATPVID